MKHGTMSLRDRAAAWAFALFSAAALLAVAAQVFLGARPLQGMLPPHQQAGEEPVPVHPALDIAAYLGGTEDGLFSHASSPPSRARRVRMATPMALSVE